MELKDFLQAFLPDYHAKVIKHNDRIINQYKKGEITTFEGVYAEELYFPEALQNYTDLVCEKQRENCHDNNEKYWSSISGIVRHVNRYNILSAPQPTIEDLINKTEEL